MNEQNFNNLGQNQSNNLNEQPASQNPEPTIQTQTVGESVNNSVNTNLNSTPVTNTVSDTISMSNNPQNNPVATPIPGTENNNMPNMGSSIGQDPGGISLGNINNNGFVEPTKVEDIGAVPPKQEKPKTPAQPEKTAPQAQQATKPNITGTPTPYVSIKSLTWEVPDYLSYSDKIKKYLQTAGKSIRLTLSSDLLLATEYAYSNQVKVAIKLKNDGTIQDIQISKSSGSNQINDIVLRTVKDTLNVVKPAPGEIPGNEFNLGLIINF